MKNRLLSIVLALLILAAMAPTTAFAVNYDDPNAAENFVVENGVLTQYLGAGNGLHVVVPDGVTEIGEDAFANHDGIVSVTLPNSVQIINTVGFRGDTALTDIYLGNGVKEVRDHRYLKFFYGCTSLQNINVEPTDRPGTHYYSVDGVLFQHVWYTDGSTGDNLVYFPGGRTGTYDIPDGTTKIGAYSFYMLREEMTEVTIPSSVKVIGEEAFLSSQGLTTIIVPEGTETIQFRAFAGTTATKIILPASLTFISNEIINGDKKIVYVPAGSYAETWCKENGITYRVGLPSDYAEAPNLDTASAWAKDGIQSAYNKGFIPTDLQDNYTAVITRAEFCRLAVNYVEYRTGKHIDAVLTDHGVTTQPGIFSDTTDHSIEAAYALGITNGTSANTFSPDATFTREQAATMIMNTCRVLGIGQTNVPNAGFADMASVSSWAVDGVNFVKAEGIMNGTGNDNFSPKGTYTRQESIVTFDRIK